MRLPPSRSVPFVSFAGGFAGRPIYAQFRIIERSNSFTVPVADELVDRDPADLHGMKMCAPKSVDYTALSVD
jgi:hypothetical protein